MLMAASDYCCGSCSRCVVTGDAGAGQAYWTLAS